MKRLVVALLTVILLAPAPILASPTSALAGRVVPMGGAHPAKAVWLADPAGGSAPTSVAVAADGSFRADGLRPGPIAIAIETDAGLYAVASPVTLAPGSTRSVRLALEEGKDTNPPPADEKKSRKALSVWNNPLTASLIVLGAAVVVGVAVDQLTNNGKTNAPASPSTPAN